jgi:hypothetical protein
MMVFYRQALVQIHCFCKMKTWYALKGDVIGIRHAAHDWLMRTHVGNQ